MATNFLPLDEQERARLAGGRWNEGGKEYPLVREKYTELHMSNFDHRIDEGFEAALDRGMWGKHTAWNFQGEVWKKDGVYYESVWQYHTFRECLSADSLQELMEAVNRKYGWE